MLNSWLQRMRSSNMARGKRGSLRSRKYNLRRPATELISSPSTAPHSGCSPAHQYIIILNRNYSKDKINYEINSEWGRELLSAHLFLPNIFEYKLVYPPLHLYKSIHISHFQVRLKPKLHVHTLTLTIWYTLRVHFVTSIGFPSANTYWMNWLPPQFQNPHPAVIIM